MARAQRTRSIDGRATNAVSGRPWSPGLGISVGLIGVQVVWGLQNIGTTRIFQGLGASVADLPILWIAGPVTGLLVQPLVGHLSDRASTGHPRRLRYLAVGAGMTAGGMVGMAFATSLWVAIAMLWVTTAAINVAMQPLRALLAERVAPARRADGYAVQAVFIGAGAVFASVLPWTLANGFGVAGTGTAGGLPPTIRLAFTIGAAVLLATVAWTVLAARRTPAFAPPALPIEPVASAQRTIGTGARLRGAGWIAAGLALGGIAQASALRREIYLVAAIMAGYGALTLLMVHRHRRGQAIAGPLEIVASIHAMPIPMRRLAITQFFTWFSMFALWVYAVPAIAARGFGTVDPASPLYAEAGDHVGILFAISDASSAVAALALPALMRRIGLKRSYAAGLAVGAIGMAALAALPAPDLLWMPAIGIGVGWAAVMSVPYAIVANAAPPQRLGEYLGIHNIFLVIPQLVAACVLGALLQRLFDGDATTMLTIAAASLGLAVASIALIPIDAAGEPVDDETIDAAPPHERDRAMTRS